MNFSPMQKKMFRLLHTQEGWVKATDLRDQAKVSMNAVNATLRSLVSRGYAAKLIAPEQAVNEDVPVTTVRVVYYGVGVVPPDVWLALTE